MQPPLIRRLHFDLNKKCYSNEPFFNLTLTKSLNHMEINSYSHNNITSVKSKINFTISIMFAIFLSLTGYAQTPSYYNSAAGTSSNVFPLGSTTNKVQWIYAPAVFRSAGTTGIASGGGTITKVYFRFGATAGSTTYTNFTISLGQNIGTTAAWPSGTYQTGLTQCFYQASFVSTGATANSWYSITLQTPFTYDPSKSLIFEMKQSAHTGTNNTVSQQGTTNQRIYGTYAATAGTAGSGLVDFGFDLAKGSNDAGITFISTPLCKPDLAATLTNVGINTIDSVKVSWSVNDTFQNTTSYTSALGTSKSAQINLSPNYKLIDGNTYTVKAWTSMPNNKKDTLPKNDTFTLVFKYVGPSQDPGVKDMIKCGPGQVLLQATPGNAADSITWHTAATGGNIIARGKSTLSPSLALGTNTFYAQAAKIGTPMSLANSMVPSVGYGSTYSGGFANLTPSKGILVDSIAINLTSNIQNATFNVYYKTGTYIGSETNRAAWTQIVFDAPARVRLVGSYYRAYIKLPEVLLATGVTYGFYATATSTTRSSPWTLGSIVGGVTVSNADLTVFEDRICYGATEFTTPNVNYPLTWETHYRPANCPSNRVPLVVTVKPSPNGAAFIKGSVFQTTQPNTNGFLANPDIVANGDKLSYEITPPTGYNNSDYGSTWIMSNFTLRTSSGRVLPSSYYTPTNPAPSGSNNAKFTFTPDANIIDSTIIMTISLQDLGPYYCDSSLTRYIFVAPRPIADFKFTQPVCDGDNVVFNNLSRISSGNILYKWDFGTGNPADTATTGDVVFTFPTHGTYNVKVTTTSHPYGYTDSKTIPVVVTEIPKVGFKVFNACLGDSVSFVNSSTIGKGLITYKWDFGNGRTSTKANPKMLYTTAGSYKVTLIATSNGCNQVMTKNAWEFARPVAKFNTPTILCDKTDIPFTNTSTISMGNMGYRWDFSDGGTSTATNPMHSFATPGAHSVKMKVISEFGCADSITKNLSLSESPLADFRTGPVCNLSNTNFIFTGSKPGGSASTVFFWDFGTDGNTTVENPSKLFSIVGKKMVTLTLTSNNGCKDLITKEISVKLQSKANFDVTDVCDGENAVFTNSSTVSSGNLNYVWKFGDGMNSNAQSPRHLYPTGVSQTYNVTLVAIVQGGCSDSVTKAVSVNSTPSSDFTYTTSGRLVNYKPAQSGNTTYHWDFGDGASFDGANAQYHYLNSFEYGKFTACLTVANASGCFSQTCKEISITGGIKKLEKASGIRVYPNPNNGNFTLSVENVKSDISVNIYNVLGELVSSIETNPLKSFYVIDLNAANGIYFVKVTNGGLISTQKITISK